MANKTKKSYTKRIKVSKNGTMQTRKNNQCHYNARERNANKMAKKGLMGISLTSKIKQMMMPHGK